MSSDKSTVREQVVARIGPLRRFAFALTGNAQDADDLLQATVERVLAKGMPSDADVSRWMYRVCKNIWIDEIRARRVRRDAVESGKLEAPQAVDGEREILGRLTLDQVIAAMQELPDNQRAVLSLVALEGCSYRDASEILAIPPGTVMSRLARARRALSDLLEAGGRGAATATSPN